MTKFCMSVDIHDVITCATFCDARLRGLGVARGRISRFPIDLRRRPYNTLALPCECVILTLFSPTISLVLGLFNTDASIRSERSRQTTGAYVYHCAFTLARARALAEITRANVCVHSRCQRSARALAIISIVSVYIIN